MPKENKRVGARKLEPDEQIVRLHGRIVKTQAQILAMVKCDKRGRLLHYIRDMQAEIKRLEWRIAQKVPPGI